MKFPTKALTLAMLSSVVLLTACGNDSKSVNTIPDSDPDPDPAPTIAMYEVMITNATANQPLSPPAALIHDASFMAWQIGAPASLGLEELAESGSPIAFIAESEMMTAANAAGGGIVMPGMAATFSISAQWQADLSMSFATMLVNTNDAFSGVTQWSVGDLAVGENKSTLAPIYDAGTEANTETTATVPGPAAGGVGFDVARDDTGYVTRHPGVVSSDDGLMTSALNYSHRFDNGAMIISVTRVQ